MKAVPNFSVRLVVLLCVLLSIPARAAELQKLRDDADSVVSRLTPVGRLKSSQHLRLAISLPLRNQQALTDLLWQLQDPASPNYRQYLTPAQFAERFGPAEKDYEAVIAFATAHGLTVTRRHPNRVILDVDGAVSDIEKTLNVTMRTYQHPREPRQFYAPDRNPTLDLGVPIMHISGLNNYELPRPRLKIKSAGLPGPAAPTAGVMGVPVTGTGGNAAPNTGSGPNGDYMGNDFRTAYVPGTTLTGTGQTVGLLQFDGYTTSDITYYESLAGRPNVTLTNVLLDGFSGAPTGNGGEVEVSLDIEMTISMAPGVSNIMVYEAGPNGNWHDILNQMATDNVAKQLSCSWYIPGGAADPVADTIFKEMALQGQSFFSASGDYDAFTGLIPFPGDTPYITEVGGTTLSTSGAGGPYSSETVWNWEDGVGSGGGISTQYAIPTWQQGISMTANLGSTTMRNVPDVAMTADNVYVRADGEDQYVGGTSCAAPLWASFTALVNQQAMGNVGKPVGFINPAVYAIGIGAGYGAAFHDTTVGNNFSTSSPAKFPAETGYDLCTGWGTPTGTGLINALAGPPIPIISTGSPLPNGVAGTPYSQALAASGGAAPYTWSISAGALPAGLSLSSTAGVISGTPSASGSASFTVQVTGSNGAFSTTPFGLTIYAQGTPIIVTTSPLASGTLGAAYSQTFTATGGATPYTWSIVSGTLPGGLALSSAGLLSGTPTVTGSFGFTAEVTGTDGLFSTSPFVLIVPPPPVITSAGSATGTSGAAFSYQISATNNPTGYGAIGLPAGLTVNTSTGLISGTAVTAGTSNATISASNAGGTGSATLTITVLAGPPVITSALSVTATSGVAFSYQIAATNGPTSYGAGGLNYPGGVALSGSNLFVVEQGTNAIAEANATTGVGINASFIAGLGHPATLAAYGGNLFVTNQYSNTVGEFNATTGAVVNASFITGASLCNGIAISATGTTFVSQDGSGSVGEYASNGTAINASFITGLSGPGQVALSGTVLFVAHASTATVGEYNAATGALINASFITGLSTPNGLAVSGSNLFVSNIGSNTVGEYNAITGAVINANFITGLNSPNCLTVSGSDLFVTNYTSGGWVGEYATTTGAAINAYFVNGLPAGLSLNTATGVISGTPTSGGTTSVTISAANASGTGSATLTITVLPGPPVITSSSSATGTNGVAFSYQIMASNNPTSYGASGLPAGLSVNTATGLISGTASSTGTSNVTVSAINSSGTGSTNLVLTIIPLPAPVITSALSAAGTSVLAFSYQITASNYPTSYGASGLPTGLSVNTATGLISGTAASTGTSNVAISAINSSGTGSATLTITILPPPPVITGTLSATGTTGAAFSYQIAATNSPTSYGASGLPSGLSVNTITGLISGTPTSAGATNVTISATNAGGTGSATLTITILPPPPVVTSTLSATGTTGAAFSYQIAATNSPTSYGASGLPAGLTVNTSTGLISGTPTSAGATNVTISATNAGGTGSAILTITVVLGSPVITSTLSATGTTGAAFSYHITATNSPTSYGASGLPAGLSVNTATGLISGTTTSAGTSGVTISAANSSGGASAILTITMVQATPVITSPLSATGTNGVAFSYQITATNGPTSYAAGGLSYPGGTVLSGSTLFVIAQSVNMIGEYNATTGATINAHFITGLSQPANVALSGGNLFVTNQSIYTVGEYSATTGTAVKATLISGASLCNGIVISSTGTIYVSQDGSGSVGEYASNGSAINSSLITGLSGPGQVALSGTLLFVAHASTGTVGEYNAATGATINANFITGLSTPNGLAVSGTELYVANIGSNTVGAYNATTGAAINANFITGLTSPNTLTVSGSDLFVTNYASNGSVGEYNANTGAAINAYFISGLPPGLTMNTATGLISGTLTSTGTSTVTISAANASGTGSATLTITALPPPSPVITSALTATGTYGSAFAYQIAATNNPTSYGASGLPAGLTVNTATGLISGTATVAGTNSVTISATNPGGTGSATLTITLVSVPVPVITSAVTATGTNGSVFAYQIAATNNPTSYGASGLPAGLTVNTATGFISGTAATAGTNSVTISATNPGGTGSATLTITLLSPPLPVITSALAATGTYGSAFAYQIAATNSPTSYGASGLPAGLAVNTATGLISGTATSTGTSNVTITATNPGGTGSATLSVTVLLPPPVITSALSATGTTGAPFIYQITASNNPTSYGASGLPSGLSVNTATGLISGTITGTVSGSVTISGSNSGGTGAAALVLTIIPASPPVITSNSLTTLCSFSGTTGAYPGSDPTSGIVQGSDGNFYGTTSSGGSSNDGTVFKITTSGSFTSLLSFAGANGKTPNGLMQASNGYLYGSTFYGGTGTYGSIFKITTSGSLTTLISLYGGTFGEGAWPEGGLVQASDGNLYGTANSGGTDNNGVVYKITTSSGAYTTIYLLPNNGNDYPTTGLVQGTDGNLYGTTSYNGYFPGGTIFKVTTTGSATTLYSFPANNIPSALIQANDGNFYGTCASGGANSDGLIFRMTPSGSVTTLCSLTGTSGATPGQNPKAALLQGADGSLYGTTANGGSANFGTIFNATTSGSLAMLYTFSNGNDGASPASNLVQATDGNFYGTTQTGGANGFGTVFRWIGSKVPSATAGTAFSYQITATNYPTNYNATGLPAGLSVNTATGLISGTPTAPGSSNVTISATNSGGTGSATITITVLPLAPVITGALSATATTGAAFTYQIAATNSPASYAASGLPAGLGLNTSTGLISGTATTTGTSNATISATNAGGTGSATLTVTVLPPPPIITSAPTVTGTAGAAFSYQIAATNSPTSFAAVGLPAGLSADPVLGLISGTATATGTSSVTISAANAGGTGSASLVITINTAFTSWQNLWFTAAQLADPTISGDTADPAGDGIPNLLKYALNLNPMANGTGGLPVGSMMMIGGSNYLTLSYTQVISATDITYIPQVSGDMQTWSSGAGAVGPVSVTPNGDGVTETVVVQDLTPSGNGVPRFIRLMVTGP